MKTAPRPRWWLLLADMLGINKMMVYLLLSAGRSVRKCANYVCCECGPNKFHKWTTLTPITLIYPWTNNECERCARTRKIELLQNSPDACYTDLRVTSVRFALYLHSHCVRERAKIPIKRPEKDVSASFRVRMKHHHQHRVERFLHLFWCLQPSTVQLHTSRSSHWWIPFEVLTKPEVVVINNSFLFLFNWAPRSPSPPNVSAAAQSQLHDFPLLFPSRFDANDLRCIFARVHLVRYSRINWKNLMKWNHKLLAIHSPRLAPRLMIIITIIKIVRSERKNYDISEGSVREKLMEMQKKWMKERNNERRNRNETKQRHRNVDVDFYDSMLHILFRFMHVCWLRRFHKRLCADQTNYILFNWLLFFFCFVDAVVGALAAAAVCVWNESNMNEYVSLRIRHKEKKQRKQPNTYTHAPARQIKRNWKFKNNRLEYASDDDYARKRKWK